MSLPAFDTPVMLRVPDREVLSARVSYGGPGWLDVEPHARAAHAAEPSSSAMRSSSSTSIPPGSCACAATSACRPPRRASARRRCASTTRQNVQLLRARTHAGGIVHARVNLVKAAGDGIAHATVTVAVGTKEFAVRDLPGAFEGDLYDFTIWPGGNEPSGQRPASVTRIAAKGHVVLDYVMVAEFERERLGRLLIAREA